LKNEVKDEKLDEMLGELDPPYESKEEINIGRLLDQYGIPFLYKQPTIIYDHGRNAIWKPTFTLLHYGGLVIDYVSDPVQNQADELLRKEQVYRHNQIPAVILGPKYLAEPNWEKILYRRIELMYQPDVDPKRYAPASVKN
jgi:hypothetical protein